MINQIFKIQFIFSFFIISIIIINLNQIFFICRQKMNQMSKIGLNANDKKQIKNELRIKDRKGGRKNVNLFDLSD